MRLSLYTEKRLKLDFLVATNRTAIVATIEPVRLESYSFVQTMRNSFVQQIEPAKDAVRMEEVVRLFSMAFAQVCALKVIDKLAENSLIHELMSAEVTAVSERLERLP